MGDPISFAGFSALTVLWAALWAAVGIVLAIVVGRDALRRGVSHPWAWAIGTYFGWGVAIVYALLRDDLEQRPVA